MIGITNFQGCENYFGNEFVFFWVAVMEVLVTSVMAKVAKVGTELVAYFNWQVLATFPQELP